MRPSSVALFREFGLFLSSMTPRDTETDQPPPAKKAGLAQVAATMFWGILMIGKKGTWEKDGATITPAQAIVGGVVTFAVIVCLLVLIVRFALR